MAEVIVGLITVHLAGFVHRDAHADNFFKDWNGHIKVGDLGEIQTDYAFATLTEEQYTNQTFVDNLATEFLRSCGEDYNRLATDWENRNFFLIPTPGAGFLSVWKKTTELNTLSKLVTIVYKSTDKIDIEGQD